MFKKTVIQQKAINLFKTIAMYFMLFGGSRSGKSFIIIYTQLVIAINFPGSRHLIARLRFNHVKITIWTDTLPKVLKICFPELVVKWNSVDYYITLPNGSELWIAGLDDKERTEKVLGMEFLTIFLNECSQISYNSFNIIKTRLAQLIEGARNMMFFDENPPSKKHWTYKVFIQHIEPEDNLPLDANQYGWLQMNPEHNRENISDAYMQILDSMPRSKRLRFKAGEFSDDSAAALWTSALIANNRINSQDLPRLKKICVAIDPATTSEEDSDETGIIVEGLGENGHLYTLEDLSGIYTPTQWADVAVSAYHKWKADRIVAEINQGGDMVETIVKTRDKTVAYKGVHATRDKTTRAEPVAAFAERGEDHHVGEFFELELEMTTWEGRKGEKSPNRIDAKVWAAAYLIPSLMNEIKRPRLK